MLVPLVCYEFQHWEFEHHKRPRCRWIIAPEVRPFGVLHGALHTNICERYAGGYERAFLHPPGPTSYWADRAADGRAFTGGARPSGRHHLTGQVAQPNGSARPSNDKPGTPGGGVPGQYPTQSRGIAPGMTRRLGTSRSVILIARGAKGCGSRPQFFHLVFGGRLFPQSRDDGVTPQPKRSKILLGFPRSIRIHGCCRIQQRASRRLEILCDCLQERSPCRFPASTSVHARHDVGVAWGAASRPGSVIADLVDCSRSLRLLVSKVKAQCQRASVSIT